MALPSPVFLSQPRSGCPILRAFCEGRDYTNLDREPSGSDLTTCIIAITGLYEKVINVKADVAAVLVSATQRFGEWW